jgi:membrane protease subunit HflK
MRYVLGLAVVLALLALSWVLTGVTQVRSGERAVVRRFGRVLADKPGPGLFIGLPWGIDRVDRVNVDLLRRVSVGYSPAESDDTSQTPPGQMVTGDHNLINIQAEVYYAIKSEEEEIARFVLQADQADALVVRAAETALVEWVAGKTVDDLVSGDRQALQQRLQERTQERLQPYQLGVTIQAATITDIQAPREVKDAFAEVAQEEAKRGSAINLARQQATERLNQAESDAFQIRRETASYALKERLAAQADAANFEKRLEQYRRLRQKDPAYLNGLWWDEISRLYASLRQNGRIDLLDHHLGPDGLDITQMPALPKRK